MKRTHVPIGVLVLLAVLAGPVVAAPKTGCSAAASGWTEESIADTAEIIWPSVLDKAAFPGGVADLEAAIGGLDRNGDGDLCLNRLGGDERNPNSHWYKVGIEVLGSSVTFNYVRDNTAGAAGG